MPKIETKKQTMVGMRSAMSAIGICDDSLVTVGTITDPSAIPIGFAREESELAIALHARQGTWYCSVEKEQSVRIALHA
jgi:hypothetical protein